MAVAKAYFASLGRHLADRPSWSDPKEQGRARVDGVADGE